MKKKIISLCLIMSVLISSLLAIDVVNAKENDVTYSDRISLLAMLGIFENMTLEEAQNTTVIRGEYAQVIAGILQRDLFVNEENRYFVDVPMDHWAKDSINFLVEREVLSVGEDKLFRPGDVISEIEALKMALCAIGYNEYAMAEGGYPLGYIAVAGKLGLSEYTSNNALTMEKAVNLTYDIITAPIYDTYYISGNIKKYKESEDSILSRYYDMYMLEGVITYADGISIDNKGMEEKGIVRIDGNDFLCDRPLMNEVGCYKSFVVLKNEKGRDKIVVVNSKELEGESIKINSDDFLSYDYTQGALEYYTEKGGIEKLTISKGVVVVKNGQRMDDNIKNALTLDKGYMRLIDADEDEVFDYVIIFDYENYVVDIVDRSTGTVYDANNSLKNIKFDEEYDKRRIMILNASGEEISSDAIVKGSVLTCFESEDVVYIVVSSNQITGSIFSSRESDKYKELLIGKNEKDTQWYRIDKDYYTEETNKGGKFTIGNVGSFYIDYSGNIAYIDFDNISNEMFAYLVNYRTDDDGDGDLYLKIFTENGDMEVKKVHKRAKINGQREKNIENMLKALSKTKFNKILVQDEDKIAGQLIRVKTNADDEIVEIDTEYTDISNEGNRRIKRTVPMQAMYYRYNAASFDGKILKNNQTVLFSVPPQNEVKNADEKSFSILSSDYFGNAGGRTFNIESFRLDADAGYEDVIITDNAMGSTNKAMENGFYLVSDIKKGLNSEGVPVTIFEAYLSGIKHEFYLDEEYDFSFVLNESGKENKYFVSEGDIIRLGRNADGSVGSVEVLYDYSRRLDADYEVSWNSYRGDLYTNEGNIMYGYIKSFNDGVIKLSYTKPTQEEYSSDLETADYVAPKRSGAVMIFDESKRNEKVYLGTDADLIPAENCGDKAEPYFLLTNTGIFCGAVVYR